MGIRGYLISLFTATSNLQLQVSHMASTYTQDQHDKDQSVIYKSNNSAPEGVYLSSITLGSGNREGGNNEEGATQLH